MKGPHIVFITSGHSPLSSRLFYKELLSLKNLYKRLTIIAPYDEPEQTRGDVHIIGIEKYKS